jgi:hypothetical protein
MHPALGESTESSAYAIDMDRDRSRRFIEQAVRAKAEVSVWPYTQDDGCPIRGALTAGTDHALVIQASLGAARAPAISEYCEVGFRLDDVRFMFTSNVLGLDSSGASSRLEIARPECLQVLQRRRYQRRDLRGNATVRIVPLQGGSRDPMEAALLNVGPGGLACRCTRADADRLLIDAPLRVAFSLRESASGFEFDARVRSKTGGAHPDQLILAIEFVPNAAQRECSERLADALYGPVAAMTRG